MLPVRPSTVILELLLRVLVACEMSGRVRDASRARGHRAVSCDVLAADGVHIQWGVTRAMAEQWGAMDG